ncbi:MAG: hypothetical protein ABIH25_04160 [Candidatus Woesearchaeota archaeon]
MIKKSIWENKKVWIAFLFLALILTLVYVVEQPKYAPKYEWSIWLIVDNQIINEDTYLPIRNNIQVSEIGNLEILNSALVFNGLEGDELFLKINSLGGLDIDGATIRSYNPIRFYAGANSECTIKDSDFINVIIDESSFSVSIVNGLDIYWYVNFDVVDSRGINIYDADFSLDGEIINYDEPYAVFAKTINNVDEYYALESASHDFIVSKEGYTLNNSYSDEIIDGIGFNYVIGINYIPSFINNIENQQWTESEGGLEYAFDLNDYFEDLDNELIYSVSGNLNIQVDIDNGVVSFSSPEGWTGSETIIFRATEVNGELYIESNEIRLEVLTNLPVINLISPEDEYIEENSNDIIFSYSVVQGAYELDICSIFVDDENMSEVNWDVGEFNLNLDNGEYEWYVRCDDIQGNFGASLTYNLIVDVESEEPPVEPPNGDLNGNSGGSGGGGADDNGDEDGDNGDLNALFDVNVEVEDSTKIVEAGQEVMAKVQLINFGDLKPVDVFLKCNIEDSVNSILDYYAEYLAVETQVSILRTLNVPLNATDGDYDFICYLNYEEQEIFGSDRFTIISSEENPMPVSKLEYGFIVFIILILLLLFFLIYRFIKRKRKRKRKRKEKRKKKRKRKRK